MEILIDCLDISMSGYEHQYGPIPGFDRILFPALLRLRQNTATKEGEEGFAARPQVVVTLSLILLGAGPRATTAHTLCTSGICEAKISLL